MGIQKPPSDLAPVAFAKFTMTLADLTATCAKLEIVFSALRSAL